MVYLRRVISGVSKVSTWEVNVMYVRMSSVVRYVRSCKGILCILKTNKLSGKFRAIFEVKICKGKDKSADKYPVVLEVSGYLQKMKNKSDNFLYWRQPQTNGLQEACRTSKSDRREW
jgi:hypothetical protein